MKGFTICSISRGRKVSSLSSLGSLSFLASTGVITRVVVATCIGFVPFARTEEPTSRSDADLPGQFWSFAPLREDDAPEDGSEFARGGIDRFLLAKMSESGLHFSPLAAPRDRIRRLYFGLIGLPPQPAIVKNFEQNPTAEAYAAIVDELLASPQFGERQARDWLDVARFGESFGFEQDYDRPHAYHYRDFVIRAFDSDMPYDRFVRWQIAGDELSPKNPQALMATGFLGAGVFPTQLTEKEFESARYDELDDMLSTTGMAFLGLSVGCARCHDHKFDPILSSDYYNLLSSFTRTIRSEVQIDLQPEETARELVRWKKDGEKIREELTLFEKNHLPERFDRWAREGDQDAAAAAVSATWMIVDQVEANSLDDATFKALGDGSLLVTGKNPKSDRWVIEFVVRAASLSALRIEALAHESLVRGGPGRAGNGNFALSDLRVYVAPLDRAEKRRRIVLKNARASFEQNSGSLSVASSIDGDPRSTGWAVDPQFGKDHAAMFEFSERVEAASGIRLRIELDFFTNTSHTIGRPRFAITSAAKPTLKGGQARGSLLSLLNMLRKAGGVDSLDADERRAALLAYRALDVEWSRLAARLGTHQAKKPKGHLTKLMVSSDGLKPLAHHADGRGYPHRYDETFLLHRGDPEQKKGVASQAFLPVLMRSVENSAYWKLEKTQEPRSHRNGSRGKRAALAAWLTDVEHGAGHLLARVIVNRVWQHHFGRGIVATPNDFGKQGERPSHLKLLDWLARRLISGGWRLKPLHRAIVLSAAYSQSSIHRRKPSALDVENRLLWRWTPRRMEAEVLRDSLLSVSGRLDRTPFGPGTLDERSTRRSIYFTVKRSRLIPSMQLFDAPEPLVSQGRRPVTTIAPQALLLINGSEVRKCADALARKLSTHERDGDAVRAVYLTCLMREPSEKESQAAAEFLEQQRSSYGSAKTSKPRLRALTDFIQVVFAMNEFIYIR